jgi:demethylmacrocin O-methyltransferase
MKGRRSFMLTNVFRRRLVDNVRSRPKEEQHRLRDRVEAFQIGPLGWLANIPCALLFGRNLRMLATIYMTDKWNYHWFAQHYEDLLRKDRRKRINLLEIGIGGDEDPKKGGNSLRMWADYLPNARIFGADIFDKSAHDRRRIKTFRGSQADPAFLDMLVREIGKIDVIIDDGSHRNEHMLFTFQYLFPHLADGGIYVIEDAQTSYWSEYGGNEVDRNDPNTAMGYFKSLVDGLNWEEFRGSYIPTYLDQNIKSVAFYHNMIAIRKGDNKEGGAANPPG